MKNVQKSAFFSEDHYHLLVDLAREWEVEAQKCAEAGAFYGGGILAAASIEAMLLAMCELLPHEVRDAAWKLEIRGSIQRWGLYDLLRIATAAGWLGTYAEDGSKPDIGMITDIVRRLRDLAHPARHLRELSGPLPPSAFEVAWYAIDAVRERLAGKLGMRLPPPA